MGKPPKLPNDWEEVHYTHLFIPEEEFSGITKMSLDDVQKSGCTRSILVLSYMICLSTSFSW